MPLVVRACWKLRNALLLCGSTLCLGTLPSAILSIAPPAAYAHTEETEQPGVTQPAQSEPTKAEVSQEIPSLISLVPGELRSVAVEEIVRVAIGSPEVADVTIVSSKTILLQAKATGTTTLILWDRQGQHITNVEVVDRTPERAEEQLTQLLSQLNLPDVRVKRENSKLFLVGEVAQQKEVDRLEQMLTSFPGVTNLVSVPPPVPPPPASPPPLVKLAVQVVEINRKDLEKLGVKWSDSVAFSDAALSDATTTKALVHWGTSLARTSVSATLNALVQQNKARILSEPKLVTASGKEASSFIGVDVPILTATSFSTTTSAVTTNVEFRKTGVLLKMTPNIHEQDVTPKITTIIEAEVSGIEDSVALQVPVGSQTVKIPGFKVRKAKTEVTTASGETIMIAGLLEAEDDRVLSQVPALGSLPVLGRLFRSPENTSTQRELVIAVTPELLAESEQTTEKAVAVEQALAVAQTSAAVEDPTLRYALQVQDRIAKAVRYPTDAKEAGQSGQVKLRLHLRRDGSLEQALIAQPSGVEAFDAEALNAAQRQSPYPPFPPELSQQELWLELPVLFRP